MALIIPELLIRPFADSGNVVTVPQTDAAGFVNFTDGYTSAYEISLNANNPRAKAVERPIQNYLFRMLSQNAMAWQRMGYPAWQAPAVGFTGYDRTAFVLRAGSNGIALLYRSLVDNNATDPLNSPASWELQPTVADTVSRIPMPLGGASGVSASVIGVQTDFNALRSNAVFQVGSDAVAAQCQNLPVYTAPGAVAIAGLLEVTSWTFQTVAYTIQRYTDRLGMIATRTATGNNWSVWNFKPSLIQIQAGQQNYMTITSDNGTAWTGTVTPNPTAIVDGMEFKVIVAGSQNVRSNATLAVNGVAGTNPIFGTSGNRVIPSEFVPGSSLTIRFRATIGWEIMAINSGSPTGLPATQPTQLVGAGQVQSGVLNFIVDTISPTRANAYGGEFVPSIPVPTQGLVVRFVAATANNSSPTFKCSANAPDLPIRDAGGGLISSGVIQPGDIVELSYLTNQNYYVITGKTGAGAASAVPVGGILLVSTPTVPTGYLECDFSLQKIATLPQLYAAIGTFYNLPGDPADSFRLPMGRGVFVRGLDNGAGRDPNRVMGTVQQSSNLAHDHAATTSQAGAHTHTFNYINTPTSADNPGIGAAMHYQAIGFAPATNRINSAGNHTHDVTVAQSGDTESRPVNVAWMYCIKAFDTPINQGTIDVAQLLAQVNAQKTMASGQAVYNAAGSFTFIVPADATPNSVFEIQVWGGGAGGSGVHPTLGANGGGAGGYAYRLLRGLTPGQGISVIVGAGGAGGTAGGAGGAGGTAGSPSLFGSYCTANGGAISGFTGTIWPPAAGGQATGGDVNSTGGPGAPGMQIGTTPAGQIGGNGGDAPNGGGGGRGGWSNTQAGTNGGMPGGGGGGGGATVAGGAGAPGAVVIKYR